MLKLKHTAKLTGLTPQMAIGIVVVAGVYARNGAVATLTSGNDSVHGGGDQTRTLHDDGNAADFRTKDYAGNKLALRDQLKDALGPDFDVVLEGMGQPNEHMHVEYDPK